MGKTRTRPNDPCPCGSPDKYKKCCGGVGPAVPTATPHEVVELVFSRDLDGLKRMVSSGRAGVNMNLSRADLEGVWSPLGVAVVCGNVEAVQFLINANADISRGRVDIGCTPLFASAQAGHLEITRTLLASDAAVDSATSDGSSALGIAVQEEHLEVVELLLDAGAAVSHANLAGCVPLHVSAWAGNRSITKCLIEARTSVDVRRADNGATYLHSHACL